MTVADCLICGLITGRNEVSIAYQDDDVVAIMDLFPVNPGHLFVVPRRHAPGLDDLPEEAGVAVWRAAHRLARAVRRSGLRCEGVNLFLADGEVAFQEIFHVHLHVVPRFAGDSFRIDADWREAARADLDRTAAAVRAALAG